MSVKIFYCYAREDKLLREKLEKHLEPLSRAGLIVSWHDRQIEPGMEWRREIERHFDSADIVLLLVSPSFMRSDCWCGIEMLRDLQRQHICVSRLIAGILRLDA